MNVQTGDLKKTSPSVLGAARKLAEAVSGNDADGWPTFCEYQHLYRRLREPNFPGKQIQPSYSEK
eukprot:3522648-Rhodomonas_salina.1